MRFYLLIKYEQLPLAVLLRKKVRKTTKSTSNYTSSLQLPPWLVVTKRIPLPLAQIRRIIDIDQCQTVMTSTIAALHSCPLIYDGSHASRFPCHLKVRQGWPFIGIPTHSGGWSHYIRLQLLLYSSTYRRDQQYEKKMDSTESNLLLNICDHFLQSKRTNNHPQKGAHVYLNRLISKFNQYMCFPTHPGFGSNTVYVFPTHEQRIWYVDNGRCVVYLFFK